MRKVDRLLLYFSISFIMSTIAKTVLLWDNTESGCIFFILNIVILFLGFATVICYEIRIKGNKENVFKNSLLFESVNRKNGMTENVPSKKFSCISLALSIVSLIILVVYLFLSKKHNELLIVTLFMESFIFASPILSRINTFKYLFLGLPRAVARFFTRN